MPRRKQGGKGKAKRTSSKTKGKQGQNDGNDNSKDKEASLSVSLNYPETTKDPYYKDLWTLLKGQQVINGGKFETPLSKNKIYKKFESKFGKNNIMTTEIVRHKIENGEYDDFELFNNDMNRIIKQDEIMRPILEKDEKLDRNQVSSRYTWFVSFKNLYGNRKEHVNELLNCNKLAQFDGKNYTSAQAYRILNQGCGQKGKTQNEDDHDRLSFLSNSPKSHSPSPDNNENENENENENDNKNDNGNDKSEERIELSGPAHPQLNDTKMHAKRRLEELDSKQNNNFISEWDDDEPPNKRQKLNTANNQNKDDDLDNEDYANYFNSTPGGPSQSTMKPRRLSYGNSNAIMEDEKEQSEEDSGKKKNRGKDEINSDNENENENDNSNNNSSNESHSSDFDMDIGTKPHVHATPSRDQAQIPTTMKEYVLVYFEIRSNGTKKENREKIIASNMDNAINCLYSKYPKSEIDVIKVTHQNLGPLYPDSMMM